MLIPLLILLMLQGCKKCGKDVKLGEEFLMEESKENYFPYFTIDEMTFVSSSGKVLTMNVESRSTSLLFDHIQYICYNGYGDNAREYYRIEWFSAKYVGNYYQNNYELEIHLFISRLKPSNLNDIRYYDRLSCSYSGKGTAGKEVRASSNKMVHKRGNAFTESEISTANRWLEFEEEFEINGVVYYDVWHRSHKLFFQKGRGVFAFEGLDEEYYVLQE